MINYLETLNYVNSQITIYRYLLGILLFGDQSCTHYQLMYEFASSPLFFFLLFELGYFFLSIAFHLDPSHFLCLLRLNMNILSKTQMHTKTCRISRFHFGMFPLFPVLELVFLSTIQHFFQKFPQTFRKNPFSVVLMQIFGLGLCHQSLGQPNHMLFSQMERLVFRMPEMQGIE